MTRGGGAMTQEEKVNTFLVAMKAGLPAKLDQLVPLSFIGSAAVKFYQAKVKLMTQLGVSEAQRKATLADGQDAGDMLLDIEGKIGELAESEPRAPTTARPKGTAKGGGSLPSEVPPKHERLGLAPRRVEQAQSIHRNPAAVAAVKKEARKNEDIPTKAAVLNKIAYQSEKKRRQRLQNDERVMALDARKYLAALESAYRLILDAPKSIRAQDHPLIDAELRKIASLIERMLG